MSRKTPSGVGTLLALIPGVGARWLLESGWFRTFNFGQRAKDTGMNVSSSFVRAREWVAICPRASFCFRSTAGDRQRVTTPLCGLHQRVPNEQIGVRAGQRIELSRGQTAAL